MSHGGGGHAAELFPENQVLVIGAVLSLIGMYIAHFVPSLAMLLGGLLAAGACVAGANTTRRVAAYGLGTGVPSIGMVSLGMGTISALAGVLIPSVLAGSVALPFDLVLATPIIAAVVAIIVGFIVGKLTQNPVGMKVPIIVSSMTKLSLMGALAILGFCTAFAGGFSADLIINGAINNGIIALAFIAAGMSILHPFNACIGPNESHKRTITLATACGLMAWLVFSIAKLDIVSILVAAVFWIYTYGSFVSMSLADACEVKYVPELPKKE
ncbi:Tetrahydromethanopterin S-methyltransferase [Methanococcus vannielii SB]|jgi:tetrahydromethanopterin S-methyltransferase subunit C|uniref:Tetrahydromethanopterin S-methyltransferase subunit C n=1 Tax=Methanococcus vannielii (strain ATCC 35089 / DSM 1224 / JCM 13029 / OCM 148 / SB) TaxID=406327 RepID=MTRC_METVS|nr:tetrahydromethanopterin S-methyltransferase subunit C [Methanococcus vannielii]A6UQK8.1 RecName: Full=Tetrahydromethanopterin S-methyltransferase subunit C; AltName: Full=N5-methyltetrahydromethanopterin--coenzyme M methyltransferase subunit C [Methanococcus vannielii SB]ABR54780.1 Tetrahydromethanopterin S-methyltransferase [Methanococcus vannielii SB]